jgi:hypothetical protein
MKRFIVLLLCVLATFYCTGQEVSSSVIPDSCKHGIFSYRSRNELLIVQVMINDEIPVNMILDPHCRSVILFGKRYYKKLTKNRKHAIANPALESSSEGMILHNEISLGPAIIKDASIVVLNRRNPVNVFTDVNGIMGYDGFSEFKFSTDSRTHLLTIAPEASREMASFKNKLLTRQ